MTLLLILPSVVSLPSLWLLLSVALLLLCIARLLRPALFVPHAPQSHDFPTKPRDLWLGSFAFFRAPLEFLHSIRDEGGHRGFWILGVRALSHSPVSNVKFMQRVA